ncbi:hypothetical protein SAMN06265365_117117 [Tistlia consotensis]|uniref:Uncharacterized protein n=1 Tax=Tistlia consotensis USBA 355 TaxID=560819 RepID=A0A1Y6CFS6_9PROT|nr:hypothetical protein [Tistlia consotensis]SMF51178.1 hypothetical protein SAMN05428998_1182 [Tistlia consotensis USBA 355]SNR84719.1 hypothetical protein SAMN06265365_117117 [Tistlia consotensis]
MEVVDPYRFGHYSRMLLFLAGVLEQMDLALEHISTREVHDSRFGLMLTDNAIELVLHQIAKEKDLRLKAFYFSQPDYAHKRELVEALGGSFDAKLKFARIEGMISEERSRTIKILHSLRNELYHVGLQHEAILPDLADLYFDTACQFLARYEPYGLSWISNQKLPERAKKYFKGPESFPARPDDFRNACSELEIACAHDSTQTVESLADHMEHVVSECDTYIDIIAGGIYVGQQKPRDAAIVDCQAWPLAFTKEGQLFAKEHGWAGENVLQLAEWLGQNYPFRLKRDPVSSWRKQVARLRSKKNPHVALFNYQSFMDATSSIREALYENAAQVEIEIDRLIDQRRGK